MSKSWSALSQLSFQKVWKNQLLCEHRHGCGLSNSRHTATLHVTGNSLSLFETSGALKRVPWISVPQGKSPASINFTPSALEVVSRWVQLTSSATHCSRLSPSPGLPELSTAVTELQSVPRGRQKPLEICCMFLSKAFVLHTAMLRNITFFPLLQPPHPSLEPMWWRAQPSNDLLHVRHPLTHKTQS